MEIHLNTYVLQHMNKHEIIIHFSMKTIHIYYLSRFSKWKMEKKYTRKWKSSTDTKHVLAVVVVVDVAMSSEAHAFVRLAFARREHVLAFFALRWRLEELIIIIRRRIRFIYTAREDAKQKLCKMCGSWCSTLSVSLPFSPSPDRSRSLSIIRSNNVKNLNWAHFASQADSYKSFNLQTEYCAHFEQIKNEKKYLTNDDDNRVVRMKFNISCTLFCTPKAMEFLLGAHFRVEKTDKYLSRFFSLLLEKSICANERTICIAIRTSGASSQVSQKIWRFAREREREGDLSNE